MVNRSLIYSSIALSIAITLALAFFHEVDVNFSSLFYRPSQGFLYKTDYAVRLFYNAVIFLTWITLVLCGISLILNYAKYRNVKKIGRSWVMYLIVCMICGPGLVINYALKNNSGRARPSQITTFGGTKDFTPTLLFSDQCDMNCSLPSGHASAGYYYSSLAYVLSDKFGRNKKYFSFIYCYGLSFGTLVGMSRIMAGGHFLSDVTLSCAIVLFMNHVLYIWWSRIRKEPK